jgi:ATP-dependent Clp protease ATP-binding subunit ClpB
MEGIMNLNQYTQKSQEAIFKAKQLAEDMNHSAIEPAHLLLALLQQEEGIAAAIVMKVAGGIAALRDRVKQELEKKPKMYGAAAEAGLSKPAADVLAAAERFAKGMQDDYVSVEISYWH